MRLKGGDSICADMLPPKGAANIPEIFNDQPMERVLRKTLAVYANVPGAGAAAKTITFYVHNPSTRLRVSLSVGWDLDPVQDFAPGATAATWQLQMVRISPSAPGAADLDFVFVDDTGVPTAKDLPDAYEVDSIGRDLRGTVVVHDGPGNDLASGLFGRLVIEARWEPHDGVYAPDLWQLLKRADLQVVNQQTLDAGTT